MSDPLELFDELERIRIPTDVALHPDHTVAAFCAAGRPDPTAPAAIHVVELASKHHRTLEPPPGYRYACTRFDAETGDLVAACGVADGELETLVHVDAVTGEHRTEIALSGAIEELVSLGGGRWLTRVADIGAERDGMHLGTRVQGISGPLVLSAAGAWRRLVSVDLVAGTVTDHPTPGWTIWDIDVATDPLDGDDVVAAVASREPSPAGYYRPALLRISLRTGELDVLHETDRQLARPRLDLVAGTVTVIEGRSIVAGPVRRIDLATGGHDLLEGPGDTTGAARCGDQWWWAGWDDRGSFVAVGAPDRPDHVTWIDGTVHGHDAQPSVVPLDEHRCLAVIDRPDQPAELSVIDVSTGEAHVITRLNDHVVDVVDRPSERHVAWSSGGVEIHGGLIRPSDADRPRPLVVMVHGGPTWLWSSAYSPAESNQLALPIVAAGADVLLANPRGSSGRGLAFADAVAGSIGEIDADDLLAGVDHLVEVGLADPERIAIVGTSYGGFMAAWLAATSRRFRCAVAFSLVADWNSFALSSAIGGGFDRVYFPDADPATPAGRDELARRSPVHRTADGVAPLLAIHGDADRITPIGQVDEVRHAWCAAGGHVETVVYRGEGHELADPRHRRDAARRALTFLRAHGILS